MGKSRERDRGLTLYFILALVLTSFLFFSISSVSAFTWNRPTIVEATLNVNHSETSNSTNFWDNLDTPDDIFLSDFGGNFVDTDLDMNNNRIHDISEIVMRPGSWIRGFATYVVVVDDDIIPRHDGDDSLGNSTNRFLDGFFEGNITAQYFNGSGAFLTNLNVSGDITGYILNISFLYGAGGIGGIDLRGDPWYFSGADFQFASNITIDENVTAKWFNGKFNWTTNDTMIPFDGSILEFNRLEFNDSVKRLFTETQVVYNATTIVTQVGILDSGDIESVKILGDGNQYNVSEVTGTPGFTIDINFSGVVNFNTVALRGQYSGGAGHSVEIQLKRVGGGWETREEITDQMVFGVTTFDVFIGSNFIDTSGNVSMRINHDDPGNPAHDYSLDAVFIGQVTGLVSGGDLGDLTGRDEACLLLPDVFCKDGSKNLTGALNMSGNKINDVGRINMLVGVEPIINMSSGFIENAQGITSDTITGTDGEFGSLSSIGGTEPIEVISDLDFANAKSIFNVTEITGIQASLDNINVMNISTSAGSLSWVLQVADTTTYKNIIPDTDDTREIGNSVFGFKEIFTNSLDVNSIASDDGNVEIDDIFQPNIAIVMDAFAQGTPAISTLLISQRGGNSAGTAFRGGNWTGGSGDGGTGGSGDPRAGITTLKNGDSFSLMGTQIAGVPMFIIGSDASGGAGGNPKAKGGDIFYTTGRESGSGTGNPGSGNHIFDGVVLFGRETLYGGANVSVAQFDGNVTIMNGSLFFLSPRLQNYSRSSKLIDLLPRGVNVLDERKHINCDYLSDKECVNETWNEYPYTRESCGTYEYSWIDENGKNITEEIYGCADVKDLSRPVKKSIIKLDVPQVVASNLVRIDEVLEEGDERDLKIQELEARIIEIETGMCTIKFFNWCVI